MWVFIIKETKKTIKTIEKNDRRPRQIKAAPAEPTTDNSDIAPGKLTSDNRYQILLIIIYRSTFCCYCYYVSFFFKYLKFGHRILFCQSSSGLNSLVNSSCFLYIRRPERQRSFSRQRVNMSAGDCDSRSVDATTDKLLKSLDCLLVENFTIQDKTLLEKLLTCLRNTGGDIDCLDFVLYFVCTLGWPGCLHLEKSAFQKCND